MNEKQKGMSRRDYSSRFAKRYNLPESEDRIYEPAYPSGLYGETHLFMYTRKNFEGTVVKEGFCFNVIVYYNEELGGQWVEFTDYESRKTHTLLSQLVRISWTVEKGIRGPTAEEIEHLLNKDKEDVEDEPMFEQFMYYYTNHAKPKAESEYIIAKADLEAEKRDVHKKGLRAFLQAMRRNAPEGCNDKESYLNLIDDSLRKNEEEYERFLIECEERIAKIKEKFGSINI